MRKRDNARGIASIILVIVLLIISFSALLYSGFKIYNENQKKASKIMEIEEMVVAADPEKEKFIANLKMSLDILMEENSRVKGESKRLFDEIDGLKQRLSDRDSQISFLGSVNTRLEGTLKDREEKYAADMEKAGARRQDIEKLLEEERAKSDNTYAALTGRIEDLTERLESLRAEKEELSAVLSRNQKDRLVKESAKMHYNLGNLFVEARQFDYAIEEYKRALELIPNDADTHFNLAVIYDIYNQDHLVAAGHYRRCLQLDPDFRERGAIEERILMLELEDTVKITPTFAKQKSDHPFAIDDLALPLPAKR